MGDIMDNRLYLNTVFLFVKALQKKKPHLIYLEICYITEDWLDRYYQRKELPDIHKYIAGIIFEIVANKLTIEQLLNMFKEVINE